MPDRNAIRQFNKVADVCPKCGSRKPKDLVEGPAKFHGCMYLFVCLMTLGLAIPFIILFRDRPLMAYCHKCDSYFPPAV